MQMEKQYRIMKEIAFAFQERKVIQDNVFKNEPSKICGRQPLKNLK